MDFTVRKMRYLYILYAKSIVVFDIGKLLDSQQVQSNEVRFLRSIKLSQPSTE